MIKSILVGLDGSPKSEAVIELSIRWAQRNEAVLVGLGIVDEPGVCASMPVWAVGGSPGVDPVWYTGYEDQVKYLHQHTEEILDHFADRCRRAGVSYERVETFGSPQEKIEGEAQSVDLVLLGSETHFRYKAQDTPDYIGWRILKDAARPVVIVPEHLPEGDQSVLIAYDGSPPASRTLWAFQASGLGQDRQIHLVSVDPTDPFSTASRGARFLRYHGIEATPHALATGDAPASAILETAQRTGAGLLVMGAFGQPKLRELFIGSVTQTALRESPLPMFLFH